MDKALIYKLMGAVSDIKDEECREILIGMLDKELMAVVAPEKKKRDTSGVAKVDPDTDEVIETFATIKDANLSMGKKANSSSIGDAVSGKTKSRMAYGFRWIHVSEIQ